MKISYAISAQDTKFKSIAQGNLGEMLSILDEFGFDGIELGIRDPASIDIPIIEKLLNKHKFKLAAIGTGQAYVDEGISLSDDNEAVRLNALERLKKHVKIAQVFNSHVILGLIIGNVGNQPDERDRKYLYIKSALKELSEFALKNNVNLVIEPLNRYERDVFNTAKDVNNLIEDISCSSLGLLLDTFHMNIEEENILTAIEASAPYLQHVHLADSNRLAPGKGHMDFYEIIGTLKKINYQGFLSFEIIPSPSMEKAALYGINHINKIFKN